MPLPTSNLGALITTVDGIPPCRIALYVNSIAALQVRTAARQGEWWWKTRARKFMSSGSNKAEDGCLVVVPRLFRTSRREFPDLTSSRSYVHLPSALTKVLPAQMARAAQSAATSQLVRRAQHVRRRGAVKHRLPVNFYQKSAGSSISARASCLQPPASSAKSKIYGDREIRTKEKRRTSRRSACELGIVPASRTYPARSVGRSGRPTSPVGRCSS